MKMRRREKGCEQGGVTEDGGRRSRAPRCRAEVRAWLCRGGEISEQDGRTYEEKHFERSVARSKRWFSSELGKTEKWGER